MGENLSIEELIKKAEEIKKEAERQLQEAEKKLDERAKVAIDEVTVDARAVVERVSEIIEEEDDIKEYKPASKSSAPKKSDTRKIDLHETKIRKFISKEEKNAVPDEADDDMKIFEKEKTNVVPDVKTEKTSVVPDVKRDKKSHIKREKAKKEEKGGFLKTKQIAFVSKTTVDEESDMQSIPTIVAREHIYDAFDNSPASEHEEETGIQMTFEGFDDKIESLPTIDEDVAEKILIERRKEKIGKFRLFGPEETNKDLGNGDVIKDDFASIDEKGDFVNNLYIKKRRLEIRNIITAVLCVPLLLMTFFRDRAFFPSFLGSHTSFFAVSLVLYAAIIAVNFNVIIHGFTFKKSLNYDFPVSVVVLLILAHTAALLFYEDLWLDNGVLLAGAGVMALFLSQVGKCRMMSRIIDNFEFITLPSNKYTVENIMNTVDAQIISRGFIDEEPVIKTSVRTDFPTNFLEISCKREPADKLSRRIFPIMLLLNIALLVTVGLLDNFNTGFNMALCGICISLPMAALYLSNSMLCDISKQLNSFGSRVCGVEGAVMADDSNVMVMEAADLFAKNSCDLIKIKTFNGAKVDDAIVQAAAVIIHTKSPLAHVFDDVIIGKQSILPQVENVQYEDKMGTSAWIYNRKVLVGNRYLLLNHGVSVPKESFEKKFSTKGRRALYLAVDGEIVAMFIVSYSADPDLKRELRKLEKSGITIIVKSCDPYINEESLRSLFSLPEGYIRVMNYSAARVYDKYSDMNVEKSPAYLVHNGTALGFVSAMRASKVIVSTKRLISFLESFGCAIGFIAIAMLSVIGAYTHITTLNVMVFQTMWSVFVLIISKLRGMGL